MIILTCRKSTNKLMMWLMIRITNKIKINILKMINRNKWKTMKIMIMMNLMKMSTNIQIMNNYAIILIKRSRDILIKNSIIMEDKVKMMINILIILTMKLISNKILLILRELKAITDL